SELLAELLMSDSAISEDLLDRARQLGIPVSGWHLVVRVEADDLDEAEQDEVRRFELLEAAGQAALQAVTATGESWYLSRIARAIILIRVTTSNPGPQAGARAARSAERALQAITARLSALRFRAGVGAAHEGPMGLPGPPARLSTGPAKHRPGGAQGLRPTPQIASISRGSPSASLTSGRHREVVTTPGGTRSSPAKKPAIRFGLRRWYELAAFWL